MDEREHYRQLAEVTPSHPWDSTVAILIRRGNQLAQHGTGTLFSIGEDAFLVTAAHVVQSAKDTDAALYVATPERAFLQLVGNCFLSADEDGADVLDVALFSLNGALKQAFRSARWLRLSDVSIDFDVPSAVYCVYGYPAIWTHKSDTNPSSLDTRPLQYATYTYDDSTSALKDFDDRFHIALAASLDDTRDENATPVD
ncbi:MAG: hypothetical protein IH991_21100, partial [Planctomycetes bacterium]|nr:hypothetical protein [Planctomycetota bacterium]